MEILTSENPILHKPCDTLSFEESLKIGLKLREKLAEINKESFNSLGLSAPQIGENARVFVTQFLPNSDIEIYINPEVISFSTKKKFLHSEGCLSLPGDTFNAVRSLTYTIKYIQESGESIIHSYYYLQSAIIQHEYDHLEGRLIYRGISKTV